MIGSIPQYGSGGNGIPPEVLAAHAQMQVAAAAAAAASAAQQGGYLDLDLSAGLGGTPAEYQEPSETSYVPLVVGGVAAVLVLGIGIYLARRR